MPSKAVIEHRLLTVGDAELPFPMEATEIEALYDALSRERLSMLRLVSRVPTLPRDSVAMINACNEAARLLLGAVLRDSPHWQLWLFVAHDAWQERTRLTAYRGLWKNLEKTYRIEATPTKTEVTFQSSLGLRFAAMLRLESGSLARAFVLAREERNRAALLLRPTLETSESELVQIFHDAFPERKGSPDIRLRWGHLIRSRCLAHELVIRPGGSWDEREYSIDFYGIEGAIRELFMERANEVTS